MGRLSKALVAGLLILALGGCATFNVFGGSKLPVPPWKTWSEAAQNMLDQGWAACPQGPVMKVVLKDPGPNEIIYILFFEPKSGNFLMAALHPKTENPEWLWRGNWKEGDDIVLQSSEPFPPAMNEQNASCTVLFGSAAPKKPTL